MISQIKQSTTKLNFLQRKNSLDSIVNFMRKKQQQTLMLANKRKIFLENFAIVENSCLKRSAQVEQRENLARQKDYGTYT